MQHHSCQCDVHIHRRPESLLHAVLLLRVYFYVVLDFCCTYKVAHKINVGLRQKTYGGLLLGNIQTIAKGSSPMLCSDLIAGNELDISRYADVLLNIMIARLNILIASLEGNIHGGPCRRGLRAAADGV